MKRLTKSQREAKQRAALSQRVHDLYAGAWGRPVTEDDFCTAEDLSRVLPALKGAMTVTEPQDYVWCDHNLGEFNDPKTATEFLYRAGVRA